MIKLLDEAYQKHIKNNINHKSIKAILYMGAKYKKDIRFKNSLAICGTKTNYDDLIPNIGLGFIDQIINSIIKHT